MRRTMTPSPFLYPLLLAIFFLCRPGQAAGEELKNPIGRFVIAKGNVLVMHRDAPVAAAAKVKGPAFFLDRISTARESRAKILFLDDTVLTIAPNSTVEITEAVYDPGKSERKTVISLVSGMLKALVRPSEGSGSNVAVQTATAVAAVRGSRFIVVLEGEEEKGTRILNISDHSEVEIRKAAEPGDVIPDTDQVIRLDPGNSGLVPEGVGEIVIEPIPPHLLAGYEQALGSSGNAEDAISETSPTGVEAAAVSPLEEQTEQPDAEQAEKPTEEITPSPEAMIEGLHDDGPFLELIPELVPDQQPPQPSDQQPSNVTIRVQIP